MIDPHNISLEDLIAEDGQCVRAGLPESVRRDLDHLAALDEQLEADRRHRERVERLFADIAEHEARIAALRTELVRAVREYAGIDPAARAPAA